MTRFSDYYRAHKQELPITVWRDAPVQHFDTTSGDYVWPVTSANCKALPDVELLQDNTLRALHPSAQVSLSPSSMHGQCFTLPKLSELCRESVDCFLLFLLVLKHQSPESRVDVLSSSSMLVLWQG